MTRTHLNLAAGLCGSIAAASAALSQHPLIAAAFLSVASFLVAWANISKPGDIKPAERPSFPSSEPKA